MLVREANNELGWAAQEDGAFLQNGVGNWPVAGGLARSRSWDPDLRRPFFADHDPNHARVLCNTGQFTIEKGERLPIKRSRRVIDVMNGDVYGRPVINDALLTANDTALRKEVWIQIDKNVFRSYRSRLRAWQDLLAMSSIGGFNAYAKLTYEYEAMSDPGEAVIDMDGATEASRNDGPLFKLRSIPLPIVHTGFLFTDRQLAVARNSDSPPDLVMTEAGGRRIGEFVEKGVIGVSGGFSGFAYGGQTAGITAHDTSTGLDTGTALGASTLYGYTTFPHRATKTNFTAPTAGGWVPDTTRNELITAINLLYDDNIYGPFILYHSTDWSQYMERVYSLSGGNNNNETLRTMILKTEGISDVRRLDLLTSTFTFILVSTMDNAASAINGMGITTTQWNTRGGKQINFDIAVIQVPLFRSDYSRKCGILHGTTT